MIEKGPAPRLPSTGDVLDMSARLQNLALSAAPAATFGHRAADGTDLLNLLTALERLKAAAAAAQARVSVNFAAGQLAAQRANGVSARDIGKGIGAQVALARRESPHQGARHLGLARALVHEMPHTLAALAAGQTSEWRVTLLARETACLTREQRGQADAELATRPGGIGAFGDRDAATEARRVAYRIDPYAATDRARRAESERRVSVRPAPDTMAVLSGLLPARHGIAVWAGLSSHADSRRAAGDERTRGQIMADTLVKRVTGCASVDALPVEIGLVITDQSLLGSGADAEQPAELAGYGPVPAPLARDWLRGDARPGRPGLASRHRGRRRNCADTWVRRLFTHPVTGALTAMESSRRSFGGNLRRW